MRATEVLLQGDGVPGIQSVEVGNEEGVKDRRECQQVSVTVTFRSVSKEYDFAPKIYVQDVKEVMAEMFGFSPARSHQYELEFAGTEERPEPLAQIGALVSYPDCSVSFDLVPRR